MERSATDLQMYVHTRSGQNWRVNIDCHVARASSGHSGSHRVPAWLFLSPLGRPHEYSSLFRPSPGARASVAPNLSHTVALSHFANKVILRAARHGLIHFFFFFFLSFFLFFITFCCHSAQLCNSVIARRPARQLAVSSRNETRLYYRVPSRPLSSASRTTCEEGEKQRLKDVQSASLIKIRATCWLDRIFTYSLLFPVTLSTFSEDTKFSRNLKYLENPWKFSGITKFRYSR